MISKNEIKAAKIDACKKTLGVCIGLSLQLIKQFNMMKEKLIEAMGKLKNIMITTSNAYTFYNIYLTKQYTLDAELLNYQYNKKKY